ncbi:RagB/SusD family nutrient uptake outer membrane protein [Bacteroides sp. CR5/BHMF/2]|nr:RagB/SusD family nutrient uptake outer membrane protein [Bacteroides sp. CR5/BHMF/2]
MSKWVKDEKSGAWSLVDEVSGLGKGDFQISQYQDFIVMRYADVLLMAAELGSPSAQAYLNQVRQRAYTVNDGKETCRFQVIIRKLRSQRKYNKGAYAGVCF